jgi:hypothetical protein
VGWRSRSRCTIARGRTDDHRQRESLLCCSALRAGARRRAERQHGALDRGRRAEGRRDDLSARRHLRALEPFCTWIANFFTGNCERKNGAIVAGDFYYKERARREFTEALITELTFPKLDAQDKNTVYMNVTLGVESIDYKKGDGSKTLDMTGNTEAQKAWKACNFTFSLDGFKDQCTRVTKIDSFTVKLPVIEYHSGGSRTTTKTPTMIEYPNLTFYVPEPDAQAFDDHFKKRGIQGEVPGRLNGELTTFDNAWATKFTLQLFNCDIINITPDKLDATSEEIKLVKIDLYVERMSFNYGGAYGPETGGPV